MKIKLKLGLIGLFLGFVIALVSTTSEPNQKLVIQFSDIDVTLEESQKALESVKAQLEVFGATQFRINHNQDGSISISYYSTAEIEQVHKNLSEHYRIKFAKDRQEKSSSGTPGKEQQGELEFNISEILLTTNTDWDSDGIQFLEYEQKSDRFNPSKKQPTAPAVLERQLSSLIKTQTDLNFNLILDLEKGLYKLPEVRAGPPNEAVIV